MATRAPYHDFCGTCRPKVIAMNNSVKRLMGRIEAVLKEIDTRVARLTATAPAYEEPTTTPEDTLQDAGISTKRQARYQRRLSSLLAGRE
jgi:hypothetical protein